MKVFISWSGERSRYVANCLYGWVGNVNHFVKPLLSEEIPKGVRWSAEVAKALDETKFGIFCVTPENQSEPWLNFEAGALSKAVKERTYVCPYLVELKPTDIVGPLKEFQLTKTDREDTFRLMHSMNQALGEQALPDEKLKTSFNKWWPDLDQMLKDMPALSTIVPKTRDTKEMQEETLELVRNIERVQLSLREEVITLNNQLTGTVNVSNWGTVTGETGPLIMTGVSPLVTVSRRPARARGIVVTQALLDEEEAERNKK